MSDDYISREATRRETQKHLHFMLDDAPISQGARDIYEMAYRHVDDVIQSLPTADVRPVVRGKWIEYTRVVVPEPYNKWEQAWKCDKCGFDDGFPAYNFCPNCGADMREEDEHETTDR